MTAAGGSDEAISYPPDLKRLFEDEIRLVWEQGRPGCCRARLSRAVGR